MSKLLVIDGSVLIKIWATGFLVFNISGLIHLLPALAIIAFLIHFLYKKTLIQ